LESGVRIATLAPFIVEDQPTIARQTFGASFAAIDLVVAHNGSTDNFYSATIAKQNTIDLGHSAFSFFF
jgi:hypothetical protein